MTRASISSVLPGSPDSVGVGGLVTQSASRLEELILVASRWFTNNQQPLEALLFCIAGELIEHCLNLGAAIRDLPIELLAPILRWIGMVGIKIQLVLAHVNADDKEILGVNFIAYRGYVKHGKPPFLIREFALVHRESEASFSVFQSAQP